jgi:small-conductance mechanosensitive channel
MALKDIARLNDAEVLNFSGSSVTLGGVTAGVVIIVASVLLSRIVGRSLRHLRERSPQKSSGALYVLEKLSSYGLIFLGVVTGLTVAGINLSSLAVFAGAIGIGVGLGLQGVVKEFVSGLFLIFDRMVSVGDYVELDGGVRGAITEIGPRATRIRTNDNVNIIVPNSSLIQDRVTNWTLKGDTRRIHIPFSVATGTDRGLVREAVLEAARGSPFTLPETDGRKSQVWLTGFGQDGLKFELLVWPTQSAVKRPASMQAAYTWLIADALDAAGIKIPVPQTDIRLRSVFEKEGDEAREALGWNRSEPKRTAGRKTAVAAPPTEPPAPPKAKAPNDAAEELLSPETDPTDTDTDRERLSDPDLDGTADRNRAR